MEQLTLLPHTAYDLEMQLKEMKVELGSTRRGAFREIGELKKDYEFLQTQVEILSDLKTQVEILSDLLKAKAS